MPYPLDRRLIPFLIALSLPGIAQDGCSDESDGDGDGYTIEDGDCDDGDPAINPGASDVCGDGIDNDCDGGDGLGLDAIQGQIFNPSCISCHGESAAGGMDLRPGESYGNTVNVPAEGHAAMVRIAPGDPNNAYLMHKLWGTHRDIGGSGNQMPLGGDPLSEDKLAMMEAWIAQGAPQECEGDAPTPPPATTFFYGDVQPILWENCQGCHTDGGIAPFNLDSYEDASLFAAAIVDSTSQGRMPPWLPDERCAEMEGSRTLSQAELDTLSQWYAEGAPEGDPALDINQPPPTDALPRIDLTVDPGGTFTPSDTQEDDYHCFVMSPSVDIDTYLQGFNVLPGARSMVHHVLVYTADAQGAASADAADPALGYTCFGGPDVPGASVIGAWIPGSSATLFPPGTGVMLSADDAIVMQIHYNTTYTSPVPDRTQVQLMLSDEVDEVAEFHTIRNGSFAIPPNTMGYVAEASYTAPIDVKVYGATPHMHELGVRSRAWIDKPLGGEQCLIDIPDWDFNWQQLYFYDFSQGPQLLKAGETVRISCEWDNPGDLTVKWGEGTQDEMCITYFYVTF